MGSDEIQWEAIKVAEGGWDGAYRWAARGHDACVLVPVSETGGIARGQYQIGCEFARAGKRTAVLLVEGCRPVARLVERPAGDWKRNFAACVVQG